MTYIIKEQLSDDSGIVFKKLNSLKNWLSRSNGLGLQFIIGDILESMKSNISDEEIQKYTDGANLLKNAGKINEDKYNKFLSDLPNKNLVYVDGKWHPVNKLNTNYSDLSKLLTDLLYKSKNNGRPAATEIINTIVETNDEDKIKNVLLKYKPNMGALFNQYIKSPDELLDYTDNIRKNSELGEKIENQVANKLLSIPGYKLLYQGGDGDYIDMVFSTDLIFESPRNEVKTIQVKSSENQAKAFIKDLGEGRHKAVDILIYPVGNEYKIYSVIDGETKSIKIK
jgi:hypothetical protein